MNTELIQKYFQYWNTRNTAGLSTILSEDVTLSDWDLTVHGKEAVIKANENIWEDIDDIQIKLIDVASNSSKAFCHIIVSSKTHNFTFDVIDVLTIDNIILRVDAFRK